MLKELPQPFPCSYRDGVPLVRSPGALTSKQGGLRFLRQRFCRSSGLLTTSERLYRVSKVFLFQYSMYQLFCDVQIILFASEPLLTIVLGTSHINYELIQR